MVRRACKLQAEQIAWEAEVTNLVLLRDVREGGRQEAVVTDEEAVIHMGAQEQTLG
jgi:hypothetical protein